MFNDLHIQSQKRLINISKCLNRVIPIKTGVIRFSISDILNSSDQLLESVGKVFKKYRPYIYTLSTSKNNDIAEIRATFSSAKAQKKYELAYARLNTEASSCLYVGSSYDLLKRFKEHIGYGAKSTYALHLLHWAQNFPSLRLNLHYAEYQEHTPQDLLQALEDALWEQQRPMFGRKGSK